ncbi:sensor histidine kinase [Aquabacterium soli]|uniref:histidine kinase n=1 Tax=Aquabacterium soli TaxID=2493092 RepID=A0A3R8U639_9BURK|nr:HAMP domain-containing sensor histidine kinase [Aquabacterium soli]RRS05468.1 sensor histidine kinase [Aquabacterium soli]
MESTTLTLIAHDLKNALGSLEGELEALIDEPDPVLAHTAYIHCTELRRQFVQFLAVYGSSDGLAAHSEDESPIELLQSLTRMAQIKAMTLPSNPRVRLLQDQSVPAFWYLDRRLVSMAMEAALHNASRFARKEVTLRARQDADYLVLVVEDDGPGLGAVDPNDHSTGLGTMLCEAVAKAHRCGERIGRASMDNRPEGGVRFELWLP